MFFCESVAYSGIESHAECAEERLAVDGTVVAGEYVVGGDDACGQFYIDGDADVAGQSVSGAGRQDAQSGGCAHETGGYFVDCTVASACEYAVVAAGGCFGSDVGGVSRPCGESDIDLIAHAP